MQVLQNVLQTLRQKSKEEYSKAIETMKSKANVDGPWQSKQPDEMIRFEEQARIYQQISSNFRKYANEIEAYLFGKSDALHPGSVFVWEIIDPDNPNFLEETVIITPSDGGQIGNFRLLSEKTPLAKALIDRKVGKGVNYEEFTIRIKEIF